MMELLNEEFDTMVHEGSHTDMQGMQSPIIRLSNAIKLKKKHASAILASNIMLFDATYRCMM